MRRLMTKTEWLIYRWTKQLKGKKAASRYAAKVTRFRCDSAHTSRIRWQLVCSDSIDSRIYKTFLPYYLTIEEWQEFYQMHELWCRPSAYDCTGDTFTAWMERFSVPAGTWVYHCVGIDI